MDRETTRRRRTQRIPGPRLPRWDLGLGRNNGLLFWAYLVWGGGFALYLPIWTLFVERLGASPGQIGLVVGGSAIARTVLALPAGHVVDRLAPKPVMIGTMALPVLGMLILLGSTAWWHALVAALVVELSGLAIPAVSAYVAAAAPPEGRTRAYTYVYTVSVQIGLVVGPATGGLLAERVGFRAVFAVAAGLFAGGVAILTLLENTRRPESDPDGATAERAGYRTLLRLPGVRAVVGFHLLVPLLPFTGLVLLANFLANERELSVATIGTLGSVGSAVGLGAGLLVSHWKPLGRPFFGLGVCLSCATAALGLFLISGAMAVVVLAFMLRAAANPVWSLMSAAAAAVTPERYRGRVYGLCETAAGAGDVGAPLLAGQLYAVDPRLPLVVALTTTAPLALGALGMHWRRERPMP